MADGTEDTPKLHIDSDWKAEAQAEKAKLAEADKPAAAADGDGGAEGGQVPGGMPPANFETLISTMVTQALFAMGAIPDPQTGERYARLDLARHHIDMLSILEEKTAGNVTDEEAEMLKTSLYELRSRYIQLANQARAQAAPPTATPTGAPAGAPHGSGAAPTDTGGPGITI